MKPTIGENREARSALLAETLTAVDGLDSLVENLLVMNRLDSGMLKAKKSRNDVVDLLSMVADALRRQSLDYPLQSWSTRMSPSYPSISSSWGRHSPTSS